MHVNTGGSGDAFGPSFVCILLCVFAHMSYALGMRPYPDPLPPTIAIFFPAGTWNDSPFKMLAFSM